MPQASMHCFHSFGIELVYLGHPKILALVTIFLSTVLANYTDEGLRGVLKEGGSKRQEAVAQAIESLGGKLEAFYFAFVDYDVVGIGDMPDNVNATSYSLLIIIAGGAKCKTVVLITPEEVDQATKKTLAYRPPGK